MLQKTQLLLSLAQDYKLSKRALCARFHLFSDNHMPIKLLTVFFLISSTLYAESNRSLSDLINTADSEEVYNERYWLLLGHYKENTFSGYTSEADGPDFFLHPEGRENPRLELTATLKGFAEKPKDVKDYRHPQCRFPARYQWLKQRLKFTDTEITPVACPVFAKWKSTLGAESASLIFASFYINNPSSMFGHTLLKMNRDQRATDRELLDYGINYAGNPTTENPLFYAIYGLTGGFKGTFSMYPYYMKVNEYNDLESRDLWEYRLNLTPAETERMAQHLWEVGQTHFDYYYFDENCSYQLLTILEVARPDLELSDNFFYVVQPADTVRLIHAQPGLVTDTRLRPSQLTRYTANYRRLSSEEKNLLEKVKENELKALEDITAESRARIIDTAVEYLKFNKAREGGKWPDREDRDLYNRLLVNRAQLGRVDLPALDISKPLESPIIGHHTTQYITEGGITERGYFTEIGVRSALRELIDPVPGYSPYAQILLVGGSLRYYPEETERLPVELEKIELVDIISLAPFRNKIYKPSWNVRVGFESLRHEYGDQKFTDAVTTYAQVGFGPAVSIPLFHEITFYSLLSGRGEIATAFEKDARLGFDSTTSLLWRLTPWVSLETTYTYRHFLLGDTGPVSFTESRFLWGFTPSLAAGAGYRYNIEPKAEEVTVFLKWYL